MANDRKIYVGNLPPDSSVRDIEKLFNCYGKIIDIDVKNRNGPPFAFILFDDRRDAEDAVREKDGYDLFGFSLRVEFPRDIKQPKREYQSYTNYEEPPYVSHFDPYEMYMPYNYTPYQRNDGYRYCNNNDYRRGNYNNTNYTYQNRKQRPPRSTDFRILISNLPQYSNWQDVKDFMRRYGDVSYAEVFGNGTAVCDFVSKEDFKYVLNNVRSIKFTSTSGQTSYIKVEEDRSRKRGYQRKSPRRHQSRSRSRSKSRESKSSHSSDPRKSSSSSECSYRQGKSQTKGKEMI